MKDYYSLVITFFCCILVFLTEGKIQVKNNVTGNAQPPSLQASDNKVPDFHAFDWRLCKGVHEVQKSNTVVSSISVKLVLLMLYEGALGSTAKQIERAVGFSSDKHFMRVQYSGKLQSLQTHGKNDYDLDIGTKLFMDKSVKSKQEFLQTITKWYNSSFEVVNFGEPVAAIKSINQWAENITHGHIQQLVTDGEAKENTLLLLLNAVYFKGLWTHPFNANLTKNGPFYLDSKTVVEVPLMTTFENFEISTIESLKAKIISLPYEGDKFVMYIVLPDSVDGLNDLVNNINPSILGESIKNMKPLNTKVVLPKFNFESTTILGPILQKLGITDMFDSRANLKNIGTGPLGVLTVSNVLQKAGLEVNEQGSTAFAITEVELGNRFGNAVEAVFEANKPFLFLIQDTKADTIVFVGQVTNPLLQGPPIVSIPVVNVSTPVNQNVVLGDLDTRFSVEQEVKFQRFIYFDSELFQEVSSSQQGSNFVVSSASVKSILTLISEVANGDTLKELNAVLRLPSDKSSLHNLLRANQLSIESSMIDLVVANNIFVKNKSCLSSHFKDTASDLYSANISEIDFLNIDLSIQKINDQISSNTKGLINSVISKDDFDETTELLLANVLYFKGNWLVEFNESNTKNLCFFAKPTVCEEVNMMYLESQMRYRHISDINAQLVEILFKDTNFSMIILLPDENIPFAQVLKDLQHNPLSKLVGSLPHRTVNLFLPRFSVDYSTKLTSILKKMGLTSLFDSKANLSTIFSPEKQVNVKDIVHKVKIEVNEKGSRGSAITVANVITLSGAPKITLPPATVNVNRPFAFFIINRATKNSLFSGQVHSLRGPVTYSTPAPLTQRIYSADPSRLGISTQYASTPPKYQAPLQSKDKLQNIKFIPH